MLNIIIELFSIIIFFQTDYINDNFTEFSTQNPFIMTIFGILFSYLIIRSLLPYYQKRILLPLGITFSLSFMIPYHIHPIINELHTGMALIPVVIILYLIIQINQKYTITTLLTIFLAIMVYIHFGIVNSILELIVISYTNLACYLLRSDC